MHEKQPDWKEKCVRALKESLTFFSNKEKLNREKWVVRKLLRALRINFEETELMEAEEPVDVSFRDAGFQVKEIMDEGRRRTDEFKAALKRAETAAEYIENYWNLTRQKKFLFRM